MDESKRETRAHPRISYGLSSDSEDSATSTIGSKFSSPDKLNSIQDEVTRLDDDSSELDELEATTLQPRLSKAGHSPRQPSVLQQSQRARENADKPKLKKKTTAGKSQRTVVYPSRNTHSARMAEHQAFRHEISSVTARKRANFFVAKQDVFLPLLPPGNVIEKLGERRRESQGVRGDESSISPYCRIDEQPAGIKARVKPYQLLGLSFLLYMHRNGVPSILGDEMGLGKTLQTLSLLQHLKNERKATIGTGCNRPSLVVCPLSVLNSWTAESQKWTPGLNVLRFHGPQTERDRMKKVASGQVQFESKNNHEIRYLSDQQVEKNQGTSIIDLDSEDELVTPPSGVDLIVTTYEGFLAEEKWFKRAFVWRYVILDEGHRIKNESSLISRALQGLGAEHRLLLSGTPLQNNLRELWALLHWLYPEVFINESRKLFKDSFDLSKGQVSTKVMDDARALLETIMLRRLKDSPGVDLNLPPKTTILLHIPLTPMQRFWYMRLLTKADQGLLDDLFEGAQEKEALLQQSEADDLLESQRSIEGLKPYATADEKAAGWQETREIMKQALEKEKYDDCGKPAWRKLMNLLMQLRKCCNHPYMLPHAEPDPYFLGSHIVHASAKFIVLAKMINELVVKQKKKVIIFSGFTTMLDLTEDLLSLPEQDASFKYIRLDGSTSRARRNLNIRIFNDEESEYRVILISTRAGGLGINLATASIVILLDHDWNPQISLQAEARAHRIGQKQPVTVYKLCTQGTVEEQMLGRIEKKLYLSAKVTESMRNVYDSQDIWDSSKTEQDNEMPQMSTNQLMSLVRRGAQTLARPEIDVNEMLKWDWQTTLEKCKNNPADTRDGDAATADEAEKTWLSQVEQVQSRIFAGKKHKVSGKPENIVKEQPREQRRVGKNTTVLVDGHTVSKDSVSCAEWEAVPTMAGKDPRLAEPKRQKKAAISNQSHCQVCFESGELIDCSHCPRSYHFACLDRDTKRRAKGKSKFVCPQHECADCMQKTGNAGGMLYRCRWCERAYCEDCSNWDTMILLGDNLKELELLNFPSILQAYYVKCHKCVEYHNENDKTQVFCERRARQIDQEYWKYLNEQAQLATVDGEKTASMRSHSSPESMTEGPTLDSSALSTPAPAEARASSFQATKRKLSYDDNFEGQPGKKLLTKFDPPTSMSRRVLRGEGRELSP